MDLFTKRSVKRTVEAFLLISLAVLFIAGCSPKAADKNLAAIQTVIEKEFAAPDNDYRKFRQATMIAQSKLENQADLDALMEEPVYQEFTAYMEGVYAPYFTDNGYVNFINTAPAFMYSVYQGDYQLMASAIEITQNAQEPTLYDFTFQVTYTNAAETDEFNFAGNAMVPKEGKIGSIQFEDQDGLQTKLLEAH